MVDTILRAYRLLKQHELEQANDRLAELVWYELRALGEVDLYVYLRCYRRALRHLEEELDRNHDDIEIALRNAASRGCTPYEWLLVGRRC